MNAIAMQVHAFNKTLALTRHYCTRWILGWRHSELGGGGGYTHKAVPLEYGS